MNNVCITGRMVRKPELKDVNGAAVVNFSIACQRGKDQTDFFDCVAWNKQADNIGKYFDQGKPIELVGSLQQDQWTNSEGEKRSKVKIKVHMFSFVLSDKRAAGTETSSTPATVPDDQIPF